MDARRECVAVDEVADLAVDCLGCPARRAGGDGDTENADGVGGGSSGEPTGRREGHAGGHGVDEVVGVGVAADLAAGGVQLMFAVGVDGRSEHRQLVQLERQCRGRGDRERSGRFEKAAAGHAVRPHEECRRLVVGQSAYDDAAGGGTADCCDFGEVVTALSVDDVAVGITACGCPTQRELLVTDARCGPRCGGVEDC